MFLPTLNKQEILLWLDGDDVIFARGYRYLQRRMIFNTTRHGTTLRASCYGSEDQVYQLWLRFDGKKIEDCDCSCPYERECKHLVAMLLQWAFTPDEFKAGNRERGTGNGTEAEKPKAEGNGEQGRSGSDSVPQK